MRSIHDDDAFQPGILLPEHVEEFGRQVVDSCNVVHTALGPGLTERIYAECLADELRHRSLRAIREAAFPLRFRGRMIDAGIRVDILVGDSVIVEVKATDALLPIHHAQTLSYLKMTGLSLGYLVNFNAPRMKGNIKRKIWFHEAYRPADRPPPA